MNIFEEISLLFKVKALGEEIIKEIKMPTASGKPGWKTTEFYGKIFIQLLTIWGAVKGFVPANTATMITAGLEAVYNIGRVVSKAVSDIQAAKAVSTTVTTTAPVTTVSTPA